jgi:hypothetical protein
MDDPIPPPETRLSAHSQDLQPEAMPACDALALAVLRRLRPSPFTLGGGCRWIEGDTRAPDGPRFCAAPRERGRPYCHMHCLRAYAGLQRTAPRPCTPRPARMRGRTLRRMRGGRCRRPGRAAMVRLARPRARAAGAGAGAPIGRSRRCCRGSGISRAKLARDRDEADDPRQRTRCARPSTGIFAPGTNFGAWLHVILRHLWSAERNGSHRRRRVDRDPRTLDAAADATVDGGRRRVCAARAEREIAHRPTCAAR